jgi:hypothetical protein
LQVSDRMCKWTVSSKPVWGPESKRHVGTRTEC